MILNDELAIKQSGYVITKPRAMTSNLKNLPLDDYSIHFEGKHPNPIGGAVG